MDAIDLRIVNFKSHKGHDMDGFNVDLVYKGAKIAHGYDDSWGGGVQYTVLGKRGTKTFDENTKLFSELLSEVKELPDAGKYPEAHLDCILDDRINDTIRKKDEKKGIQCSHANGFQTFGWKVSLPTFIKKYKDGLEEVQKYYDELKADGNEILNGEYLKSIGVKL